MALACFISACGTSKTIRQGGEELTIDADAYNAALSAQDNDELGDAITAWKEVLEDEPRFAIGHFNLGLLYDRVHMMAESIDHYEQAVGLVAEFDDEKAAQARYNLHLGAAYLRQGYEAEAERALAITIKFDPYNPQAHYNMAGALMAQGNYDEGLLHADIAVDLLAVPDPNSKVNLAKGVDRNELASYLHRQAQCHRARKEWAKARTCLERSRDQCGVDPDSKLWKELSSGESSVMEEGEKPEKNGADDGSKNGG
jgi:tetratricopeptide (TPR) repeat protein